MTHAQVIFCFAVRSTVREPASADTVGEFRFTGTLGLLPSTETFTAGSSLPALVRVGQDGTALTPLFAKDSASDEDGIGLANSGSDHEITRNYTI
jgi:hypothetical protein